MEIQQGLARAALCLAATMGAGVVLAQQDGASRNDAQLAPLVQPASTSRTSSSQAKGDAAQPIGQSHHLDAAKRVELGHDSKLANPPAIDLQQLRINAPKDGDTYGRHSAIKLTGTFPWKSSPNTRYLLRARYSGSFERKQRLPTGAWVVTESRRFTDEAWYADEEIPQAFTGNDWRYTLRAGIGAQRSCCDEGGPMAWTKIPDQLDLVVVSETGGIRSNRVRLTLRR